MAKKKIAEVAVEEPVMVAPSKKETKKIKNTWERKDRQYYLLGEKQPIVYILKSRGIMWYDEEKGYEREIRYTTNQKTPFVDEFKGDSRLAHIVFEDGVLNVPKQKQVLQEFLKLSPDNGKVYEEFDTVQIAVDELQDLELEVQALNAAKDLDIDIAEAVMRAELGSEVSSMSSKELKRDLLLFAKNNPSLFLELVSDDNVQLRNFGIKATEAGILNLSQDNRNFTWASNGRKVMTVPFDEHPYSALAAFFKTDEGMQIYSNIEKRLKD